MTESAPPPTGPAAESFAPPAESPARPSRLQTTLRQLTRRDWITAVVTGAAAYAVAFLIAFLTLVISLLVGLAGAASSGISAPTGGTGATTPTSGSWGGSLAAGLPAQLVGLADFGRLSLKGGVNYLTTISGSAHLGFVPLFVAAAQIIALVVAARFFRRRDLTLAGVWVTSLVSGIVLAALTVIVGLIAAIRIPSSESYSVGRIDSVTVLSVITALVVGAVSTAVARPGWVGRLHPVANATLGILRVGSLHLGAFVAVTTIVLIVYALVARPTGSFGYPLLIGNLAAIVTAVGFLGGVSASESTSSALSTLSGGADTSGTLTAFTSPSGWIWVVVFFALVTAFVAGLGLAVRRNARTRPTLDWALSVGVYALGGVVMLLVGTVVFSFQIAAVGGGGSAGVTPWTIAVLVAWGAAIEAVARYVAPSLVRRTPTGLLRFGSRLVGTDSAAWQAGFTARRPRSGQRVGAAGPSAWAAPVGDGGPEAVDPSPQAGPASPPPSGYAFVDTAAPAAPMSPRAKKNLVRSLIAGGIVVVLLVGGSITAGVLRGTVYGPATAARSYLQALSDGNASEVGRLTGSKAVGTGMLTDAVFGKATDRISDVAVGKVTTAGDLATVAVRYRQGSSSHDDTVRLNRTGTSWIVQDHWAPVAPTLGTVDVFTGAALGDVAITSSGHRVGRTHDGQASLKAFPGTYRLKVADSKYFTGGTKTVVVSGTGYERPEAEFTAKATPALTTDAEKLVDDLITSCAKQTTGDLDDDCPFYGPSSVTKGVTYKVTKMPKLTVDVGPTGRISVTSDAGDGAVTINYTDEFLGESYPEKFDTTISIYQDLVVEDGRLVLDGD